MSGPEILPTTADGLDDNIERVTIPGEGSVTSRTLTGPRAKILAEESRFAGLSRLRSPYGLMSSMVYREQNGRSALTIQYEHMGSATQDDSVQELYAMDVARDILVAPYFASLTNAQITEVVSAWEQREEIDAGWTQLQKRLYGHLNHGQEVYQETAYEFRQTYQTSSDRELGLAAENPNRVTPLPRIHRNLVNLIVSLPAGEWLKKPITVTQAGRRGWTVSATWQWAPQWSVIYGGTFTGE